MPLTKTGRYGPIVFAALLAAPATAADVIVYHDWGAPTEIAALNVLKGAMEDKGHRWVSLAIPHSREPDIDVLDLIDAGNAPNVFLEPSPAIYRELARRGRALTLEEQFEASGALANFPEVVRQSITVDGHIVKAPATIHADAMIYFNRAVAKAAGVDPAAWTSLEDMWADFGAVQAAGYRPLSIGAQPWQIGYLLHSLIATLGGHGLYAKLYGTQVDPAAFDEPALADSFFWLRRFQQFADEGSGERTWNAATNAVITGQALMQVQGDWMKGEWHAAGKTEADYGCIGIPGARGLPVTVDAWGLLGAVPAGVEAAERDFAAMTVDPDVQSDFAVAKGSTPVRLDARSGIDQCSHFVLDAINRPDFGLQTPHLTASPDWIAAIWEVAGSFWNTSEMTPDAAVQALRAAYASHWNKG